MENIRVAAVQMNALISDLDHNIDVHERFSKRAAEAGCRMVVFPELSATSHYGDEAVTRFAEDTRSGRVCSAMRDLAKKLSLFIGYGFCEVDHGSFFNSYAVVGPRGLVGVQRKTHASKNEYWYFRMGRRLEVFDVGACRIGILICFDAQFFEAWRVLALKNADLVLLPHAGRSGWGEEIPAGEQERYLKEKIERMPGIYGFLAADNCLFAVHANQFGYNGHSTHSGGACIISADGSALAKAEPLLEDLMIHAELDAETQKARRNSPHSSLKMRRPELYAEIVDMI
jgi:predicted amidohydrolase